MLAEHRRVLRVAFERHGGVEVDTQGDAFFVAFPTAPGALEASRRGAAGAGSLPVRMGLHTGTPLADGGGLRGVLTSIARRASRRPATAGRCSSRQQPPRCSTAQDSATSASIVSRTWSAPERIFQVGDGEFPPLKTLYRTNLPIPATPFLGRGQELAEVGRAVGAGRREAARRSRAPVARGRRGWRSKSRRRLPSDTRTESGGCRWPRLRIPTT